MTSDESTAELRNPDQEARGSWYCLYELRESKCHEICPAPPLKRRGIAEAGLKTKKLNFARLAHLARANQLLHSAEGDMGYARNPQISCLPGNTRDIYRKQVKKTGSWPMVVGCALLLLVPLVAHAAPVRLIDGRSSRYFVVVKEDLSSYPYTTTIRNTEFLGSPIHRARILIEYWDAEKNALPSERIEIDCDPDREEWFRWYPPAGMHYYRYSFY